jgi:hypothetical protein
MQKTEAPAGRPVFAALLRAMHRTGYIQKGGYNQAMSYSFVQEAGAIDAVRPHLLEEGLVIIPSATINRIDDWGNVFVDVDYNVVHVETGDSFKFSMPGCGNDWKTKSNMAGDKGLPKAITSANKYALLKLFQMATGDDPEVPNEIDEPEARYPHDAPAIKAAPKPEPKPAPKSEPTQELSQEEAAIEIATILLKEAEEFTTKAALVEFHKKNSAVFASLKPMNEATFTQTMARMKELHGRLPE